MGLADTDEQIITRANQPDVVLVDKQRKKAIVLDVAIPGMWMGLVIPTRK